MDKAKEIVEEDPFYNKVLRSRAEVLCAMDTLIKHLNDENDQVSWLAAGVPDGGPTFELNDEQLEYYREYVDDFEEHCKLFAKIVKCACFKVAYEKGSFC